MTMQWRGGLAACALAMLAFTFAVGSTVGGQNEGPTVTLYEDIDYGGKSLTLHKDLDNLDRRNFNDLASSLKWRLPRDTAAVLYIDADYQKPLLVLVSKGHLAELGKIADGNDSISSVAFMPCPVGRNPKGIGVDVPRMGQR
jgi:hypothetical protein